MFQAPILNAFQMIWFRCDVGAMLDSPLLGACCKKPSIAMSWKRKCPGQLPRLYLSCTRHPRIEAAVRTAAQQRTRSAGRRAASDHWHLRG
jgi:hypothetical protein